MKILARQGNLPMRLDRDDTFNLSYTDKAGKTTHVLSHIATEPMFIDTALVVEVENGELGLEVGIGGVFGRKKK